MVAESRCLRIETAMDDIVADVRVVMASAAASGGSHPGAARPPSKSTHVRQKPAGMGGFTEQD